ncbi:hypothetical protein KR044_009780 [Drosophila immigrans]|nr:hypothetical protein KR044_009780 [Drosophila immigrans]
MNEENSGLAQKLCRTCLTELHPEEEAFDLFLVHGLAKKLCVCTSLSVEQQDGFPSNICPACYCRLNDLHEFQAQCVESVQKFREMVTSSCFIIRTIPEDNFSVVNAAEQQQLQAEFAGEDHAHFDPLLNSKIEIENEDDVFKMIEDVAKESEEEQEAAAEVEQDDDSASDSSDFDETLPLSCLRKKATKKRDAVEPKAKRKRLPPADRERHRLIECHICRQKFKKALNYEEHMKHHNDQLPHQCAVESCMRGFTTETGLRHHMEHTHPERCKLHPCTVEGCDKQFPQTRMLTRHLRVEHNIAKPEIHPCSGCEKVFRCPMALKKHMYKHTGEELPFGCNICNKRFSVNTELRDHLLRHAGIKNFVCPYCGVGRTTKQECDKHILTHTREKKFKCEHCEYATHNKQSLTKHVRVVHLNIRNHPCQYCEKTFANGYACRTHERLHTRESCFECNICGMKFLFEKRLTRHLKTHEKRDKADDDDDDESSAKPAAVVAEVKQATQIVPPKPRDPRRVELVDMAQLAGTAVNPIPSVSVPAWPHLNFTKKEGQFICPECGKAFNHLANMKLHYKVVHQKIKDYACRFCPKRFSKSQYLKCHENIHTGETPYACQTCGKSFKHYGTLSKHRQSHNRPPKEPKAPKEPLVRKRFYQGPKIKLNTQPAKNYEQYEDPAAEQAAATAQLVAQQLSESAAKLKAEAENQKIQTAAQEQLQMLQQQWQTEKVSYDSFAVKGNGKEVPKDHV